MTLEPARADIRDLRQHVRTFGDETIDAITPLLAASPSGNRQRQGQPHCHEIGQQRKLLGGQRGHRVKSRYQTYTRGNRVGPSKSNLRGAHRKLLNQRRIDQIAKIVDTGNLVGRIFTYHCVVERDIVMNYLPAQPRQRRRHPRAESIKNIFRQLSDRRVQLIGEIRQLTGVFQVPGKWMIG